MSELPGLSARSLATDPPSVDRHRVHRPPVTDDEMTIEPTLAMTIRPRGIFFGTHQMVVEAGGQLPVPFVDVPRSSPFWTREPIR